MFDQKTIDELQYYVYGLKDLKGEYFYIGKGIGNRCFSHVEFVRSNQRNDDTKGITQNNDDTYKLNTIKDILASNKEVEIDIIRHGLDEVTSFAIEAALIDVLNLKQKGNLVRGHKVEQGIETAEELQIKYGAEELDLDSTNQNIILIKINQEYARLKKEGKISAETIYKATHFCWRMDIKRAKNADLILGVADGIVRGVYRPFEFLKVTEDRVKYEQDRGRVYFNAEPQLVHPYLHTSVKAFGQKGQSNPIVYKYNKKQSA